MAHIHSIVYQTEKSVNEPPYEFKRTPVEQANLIANWGIEGDRKARKNTYRQLNIMSYETIEELRTEGFKTAPGELGEQIVIRGLDMVTLEKGTRLQIGESAVVEIGKPRTPCSWFERVQEKPYKSATNRVGIMAKVIHGGEIRVGDTVTVFIAEQAQ